MRLKTSSRYLLFALLLSIAPFPVSASGGGGIEDPVESAEVIPTPLPEYKAHNAETGLTVMEILQKRAAEHPFNLVATIIFTCAILHTFLASKFQSWAHKVERDHREKMQHEMRTAAHRGHAEAEEVSFKATALHFLGEVEAIFGIWMIPLAGAAIHYHGWHSFERYISHVNYAEPLFVLVIMAIAASRPVLRFAESVLSIFAKIGKGSVTAWWLSILTIGPVLGSFITEPGAMTICAMLLAAKLYQLKPSSKFAYGTLGLLFVSVSVGGTLTNFAAPPILMVAKRFDWSCLHVFLNLGISSIFAIVVNTLLYYFVFRDELKRLESVRLAEKSERQASQLNWEERKDPIPFWITLVHLLFMAWTVFTVHSTPLCLGGFLFYLAFTQATRHHQNQVSIRPALLVAFFLIGLVIHGGFQSWWIEPVISNLGEWPMMLGATILTAFNDNAAITYLGSQVPNLSESIHHALVAGAVAGGGLTVIANAPNPAGQSILSKYFPDGVNPLKLLAGAIIPTIIVVPILMLLHTALGVSTIQ